MDSTGTFKLPSRRLLDSIWLSKLTSRRNLDSIWLGKLASKVDFWCSSNPQNRALASTRAQFSWFRHFCSPSALGLLFRSSAVGLGRLLDSTWRLLGVSWGALGRSSAGLGRSWRALGRSWEALGALLGALGRLLGVSWARLGPTWAPSGLQPHSKCNLALLGSIFGALATLRIELSPARELNSHVFALLPFKTAF